MSFHIIAPPEDEARFAEVGKELLTDAARLGMRLDGLGFLNAWAGNTRVIVEKEAGVVVSMAFVASGMQWNQGRATATVLELRGNREATLDFIKVIATAMGAQVLIVEKPEFLLEVVDRTLKRVQETNETTAEALAYTVANDDERQKVFSVVEIPLT